jgi:hypothetical protein
MQAGDKLVLRFVFVREENAFAARKGDTFDSLLSVNLKQ